MRRAIQRGRSLGLAQGFLGRYADLVIELMGHEYAELHEQRETIHKWLTSEEESFSRTLEQGNRILAELLERARDHGAEGISSQDAFMLHDTYGFPIDLTRELAAEQGLGVDDEGFEALMDEQRARSRSVRTVGGEELRERATLLVGQAGFQTEFVGYEMTERETTVGAASADNGRVLAKLVESPFYATGGGQIADSGYVECADGDCVARVDDVLRIGDDQVLALVPERGTLKPGERVRARVDRAARHATECNHTATHLLHAALRGRLGTHVRQAGSYVGPDKLRFDFTHGARLTEEELRGVEETVNRWILEDQPVHALTTTLDEARRLGAMALFGEKYGDVVRMVEVGDGSFSRELCGGTHVTRTAEIALFKIIRESSVAANARRIEAVTGPEAVALMRSRDAMLEHAAHELRVAPEAVADAVAELRAKIRELEQAARSGQSGGGVNVEQLASSAVEIDGALVLVASVAVSDGKALLELADRLKGKLAEAAIVLGSVGDDRVDLLASVAPALVERGVRAGEIVNAAAAEVGGGGGGRDTLARAGGRDMERLPEALAAARATIEAALASNR
jgi:alanyl-tRNA synthetase